MNGLVDYFVSFMDNDRKEVQNDYVSMREEITSKEEIEELKQILANRYISNISVISFQLIGKSKDNFRVV